MKVLYFHQHFSTALGAAGTRSYEFAKALVKRGHAVTIVCGSNWLADSGLSGQFSNHYREGFVNQIHIIELELPYSNIDSFLKRTILFLKFSFRGIVYALNFDYDVLFSTSTPLTAGIPGIFAKIFRRKPFIFEVRDLWPELPRAMGVIKNPVILKIIDWLETLSYKFADKCIALAPGIAEGILKKFPHKEVVIIPNGADRYQGSSQRRKIKSDKFVAVFTGAHGIANGLDAVLDASKVIKDRGPSNIRIQFIGDGKHKPNLIARSQQESLTNCIFLDPMSKVQLFDYLYENVDVGLMILDNIPAFYNGTSPNKFFDYLSLGLPVLNNYPGWLASIIDENKCGITVKPDNPNEFADALIYLHDNPAICTEMGIRAKKLSDNNFDRNKLANQFIEYLESVV